MYKTESIEFNGAPRLSITLDSHPHLPFVVGAVEFLEIDDGLKLKYNYDMVTENVPTDKASFERAVGDFIVTYLSEPNPENPIVFTGGI